jgi:DNA topoisomerase-1
MEAIRPVAATHFPSQLDLTGDLKTIYSAIWFKAAGSQGRQAQLERRVCLYFINEQEAFKAEGLTIIDQGWHQLSGRLFEPTASLLEADSPVVDSAVIQVSMKPPKRHSHGSLVAWLDSNLLGKPQTYRPALEFLQRNNYVEVMGGGLLRITPKGEAVLTFVRRVSPEVLDPDFCAELEEELQSLAEGTRTFDQVIRDHWSWTTSVAERMARKSLRPDFQSPSGGKLRAYVDKESGRPFVKATDDWWSHIAFDSNGKMILATE